MVEKLGIDEDGVVELNQILYKKYGTSMAGLKVIYHHRYIDRSNTKMDSHLNHIYTWQMHGYYS